MPAQPVKRRRFKILDELGIDGLCDLYLQLGSVRAVTDTLFTPHGDAEQASPRHIYAWMHSDETGERWKKWQEAKKARGDIEFDRVSEIADEIDGANYREKNVEARIRQWVAERLNPAYSERVQHEVSGTVEHKWLHAMQQNERKDEEIAEADYELLESGEDAGD